MGKAKSKARRAAGLSPPRPALIRQRGMKLTLGLTLLLGLLSAVGPISTDIYLPAFSRIDHDFGAVGDAQITLAAWFVGLAIGQMVQGAVSDRLGRRVPLLYGTLIYSAASLGCAVAPGVVSFSAFRLLAAVSASASMVIPRAMIRDIAEGIEAARMMSRLTLVLGVVPILAPAVGGVLLTFLSWRDLFWAAGVYGVFCTALVWRFLPDTLPPGDRLRQNTTETLARYLQIAREPIFVTNVLMSGCAFAALFAYIGGSASVYTLYFHLTPPQYGVLFGVNATGYIAAAQFSARLASKYGVDRILRIVAMVLFAAFGSAALLAFTRFGGLAALVVPIFIGQTSCGLMAPLTVVNALSHHRLHAGSASALMGTWQFSLGALAGVLVALTANGTPRPMTALMLCFAVAVLLIDRLRPHSII
jgi:DHA1 family bicyclomycin/chloramphenicol resistance-like MFS transporter